ncbi:FtsW/RodA/SpoVE family cell cycle protein [Lysinibacillus sp. NPDC096418]|uniref:FtsW/RodA/SpoVE family cell cycle protein n=1 Tax=Lysinibacillus sp. NPDC096418 TaxID=3364138 RepID=UPI003829D4A5
MNVLDTYLKRVTNYIKSKDARSFVVTELTQHIKHAQQGWMNKGLTEEEALQKAIAEMGSPSTLGASLNKIHKPKVDWLLIGLLVLVMLLSFLPVMTQTMYSSDLLVKRKVIFVVLGIILAIGLMFLDYRKLQKYGYVFFGIGTAILLCVHAFRTGYMGGQPIFVIGSLRIESSMAIPFYVIAWATLFHNRTNLLMCIRLFFISLFLLAFNGQTVTLVMYCMLVAVLFWYSTFSKKIKLIATGIGVTFGSAILLFFVKTIRTFQLSQIGVFFNPEVHVDKKGFYYTLLQNVITQGKWIGASDSMVIPDSHTDFVLVGVIQSYGYAFVIVFITLLALCVIRLMKIVLRVQDPYARLLLIGGMTIFGGQFVYHVGMTFGFLPIVVMPMPFVSYGLMPTMLGAFIVGLALSVWRRRNLYVEYNGPVS